LVKPVSIIMKLGPGLQKLTLKLLYIFLLYLINSTACITTSNSFYLSLTVGLLKQTYYLLFLCSFSSCIDLLLMVHCMTWPSITFRCWKWRWWWWQRRWWCYTYMLKMWCTHTHRNIRWWVPFCLE